MGLSDVVFAAQNAEYRQALVASIHQLAIRFPQTASSVVHALMEFIGDASSEAAEGVVAFVREVMERLPQLRTELTARLLASFTDIRHPRVFRGVLWIIGEYCQDSSAIQSAMAALRASIGEVPIVASEQREAERRAAADAAANEEAAGSEKPAAPTVISRVAVLADGTYATQTALSEPAGGRGATSTAAANGLSRTPIRSLILGGDYYLAVALSNCLVKLALRLASLATDGPTAESNAFSAEAALIMASLLRAGKSEFAAQPIDADSYERISACLRVLLEPSEVTEKVFLEQCRAAFAALLKDEQAAIDALNGGDSTNGAAKKRAETTISFRHLKPRRSGASVLEDDYEDQYEVDLSKATGSGERPDDLVSKLNRVVQLTGHSDPVYAEAFVVVQQYDILLDILVVNQTNETLQNVNLELSTLGDLKLTERPSSHTLAPHDFFNIKTVIKVTSTETGIIFGNLVYDTTTASDSHVVVLNDIHIDIMDYIHPGKCTEAQFRAMWAEFEWENKIIVASEVMSLRDYLNHLLSKTNMRCLTPESALAGECGFLAANLYARSSFGEDALANVSLEQNTTTGKINGHVRIRSKTQGIALSLGDKFAQSLQVKA